MGQTREDQSTTEQVMKREKSGLSIRDAKGKYAIDYEQHRMWFRATTNELCPQDNKLIESEAWRKGMPTFMAYGPFVDSHEYKPLTKQLLGVATDWEIDKHGLLLQMQFAVDDSHQEGKAAWFLYSQGYARAVSVGWDDEVGRADKTDDGHEFWRVTEAQLKELSGCILPADAKALAEHSDPAVAMAVRTLIGSGTRPGWETTDNQIRYRIRDPKTFEDGTFKTLSLDVKGDGDVQVIRGKLKDGDGKMHAQAVHFVIEAGWDMKAAKAWYSEHEEELKRALVQEGGLIFYSLEEADYTDPDRDRIGEIIERLKRIEAWIDDCTARAACARAIMEDGGDGGLSHKRDKDSELRRQMRELASVHDYLDSETLRARIKGILTEG